MNEGLQIWINWQRCVVTVVFGDDSAGAIWLHMQDMAS